MLREKSCFSLEPGPATPAYTPAGYSWGISILEKLSHNWSSWPSTPSVTSASGHLRALLFCSSPCSKPGWAGRGRGVSGLGGPNWGTASASSSQPAGLSSIPLQSAVVWEAPHPLTQPQTIPVLSWVIRESYWRQSLKKLSNRPVFVSLVVSLKTEDSVIFEERESLGCYGVSTLKKSLLNMILYMKVKPKVLFSYSERQLSVYFY